MGQRQAATEAPRCMAFWLQAGCHSLPAFVSRCLPEFANGLGHDVEVFVLLGQSLTVSLRFSAGCDWHSFHVWRYT